MSAADDFRWTAGPAFLHDRMCAEIDSLRVRVEVAEAARALAQADADQLDRAVCYSHSAIGQGDSDLCALCQAHARHVAAVASRETAPTEEETT